MPVNYVSWDDCEENSFLRLNHHRNLASSATKTSPRDNVLTRSGKAGVRQEDRSLRLRIQRGSDRHTRSLRC